MDTDDKRAWDLEMELLCIPATGQGHVSGMQRLASKISRACNDVPLHVRELAQIGSGRNAERDLHRWVKHQKWRDLLPQPYAFEVAWTPDDIHEDTRTHYCFCPHEVLSHLAVYPELLEHLLLGAPGACGTFWEHNTGDPWLETHPLHEQIMASPELAFPVGIHGDDASAFTHAKVLVLTINSLTTKTQTIDNRILFTAVNLIGCIDATLREIYRVLVWSLNALASGHYPIADHNGKSFSATHHPHRFDKAGKQLTRAGHIGIWSELRGDWKWQHESLNLDKYYNAVEVCHLCRAHKKIRRLLYTQFSRDANVRRTRISWARFRDWYESHPEDRSPLTMIIGFTIWRCWVDCMHNLDLGVYQTICACSLFELVHENFWHGNTVDDKFSNAYLDYKDYCKKHKLQPCAKFERKKLRPSGTECPTFTCFQAKAHQTKHILFWLETVMMRRSAIENFHAHERRVMVSSFASFERICAANDTYLSDAAVHAIPGLVETALLCYNALADEALTLKTYMWHILPKAHMTTHMAYDQVQTTHRNPRSITCYPDEDMVGRVKQIVEACHGRTYAENTLKRYAILVGVRWWTLLASLRFG